MMDNSEVEIKARNRQRNKADYLARKNRCDDVLLRLDKGDAAILDAACKAAGLSRSAFAKLHLIPLLAALTPRMVDVDRARIARAQTLATFLGAAIDLTLIDSSSQISQNAHKTSSQFDDIFGL